MKRLRRVALPRFRGIKAFAVGLWLIGSVVARAQETVNPPAPRVEGPKVIGTVSDPAGAENHPATEATPPAAPLPSAPAPFTERNGGRPRIGLVLSGGGARGAAHIGVLKVLEELRVPIDAIAGTSMGAVVGGLYASGLTASEVESVMTSVNWQDAFRDRPPRGDLNFRRKQEDQNFLVKFPLGIRGGRILLPKGLIQGQKLNQMLRRLTLPVAQVDDFDSLPTRFRAVATDLVTGEAVVIGNGDITTAMRASLSAPGVFAPVEREGHVLVDGGIAENLPIDVARSMDVDVLIVVDVGFPLYSRDKLNSAPAVSNQMLAILIRRDSQRQRATLSKEDIIIDPPLGDASSYDFGIVKRAITAGAQAARDSTTRLASLSADAQDYERYALQREARRSGMPTIDFVQVESRSRRYEVPLKDLFTDMIGKPLDPELLQSRVTDYYGRGYLEQLDYELVEDEHGDGLKFTARRNSWGPNYVRFGLNLQDDFGGNARYNAAARVILSEITDPGGEWVWDLQIGENPKIATEVYLPISQTSRFFFQPHATFEARTVVRLDSSQRRISESRLRSFEYGLDFGREFGNWGEVRTGVQRQSGSQRVRVGDPTEPRTEFDVDGYFVRFTYDQLDDVNFPRQGQTATLEWTAETTDSGASQAADRLNVDWIAARSFGRNTAVWWSSFGTALDDPDPNDARILFPLGGFFNLSGLTADSFSGPHYGITRLLLYRQIGRGGPGFLDFPAYLGFSLEAGNVWQKRSDMSFGSARKDGSIFLGLDTLIGPVYLATGFDEGGREAFYLFLGRTF